VQGTSNPDRELLDAHALVGHLVPAGSVHASARTQASRRSGEPAVGFSAWNSRMNSSALSRSTSEHGSERWLVVIDDIELGNGTSRNGNVSIG
jgi:hypothetical protein